MDHRDMEEDEGTVNRNCRKVPRRDAAWALPAVACVLVLAAAYDAVTAPSLWSIAVTVVPVLVAAGFVRDRSRHCGTRPARRDLLAAMRTMDDGGLWLNRDEHLGFGVNVTGIPGARSADVWRILEDDITELAAAGSGAVACDVFRVSMVFSPVFRFITVDQVTADDTGNIELDAGGRKPAVADAWRNLRMIRTGALYAGPDEIRELISQMQGAEPLTPAALSSGRHPNGRRRHDRPARWLSCRARRRYPRGRRGGKRADCPPDDQGRPVRRPGRGGPCTGDRPRAA
jgi:hypothetical protein